MAISHSTSLSDYADRDTAAAECVGVCLSGGGGGLFGGVALVGGLFGGVVVVGGSLEGWPWCVQAPSEGAHLHRLYVTQLPDFLQSFGDYGAVFVKQVQKSQGGGGGIGCDLAPHSLGSKVTASIMDPTGENLRERQKKKPTEIND